jgi:hypothetical protein
VSWQRSNVQAAAAYLRERIAAGDRNARTKAVYEGLLEVLDPPRRAMRLQREAAQSAQAAVAIQPTRERRSTFDRRKTDRRRANLGAPGGLERRRGDRRTGGERRR